LAIGPRSGLFPFSLSTSFPLRRARISYHSAPPGIPPPSFVGFFFLSTKMKPSILPPRGDVGGDGPRDGATRRLSFGSQHSSPFTESEVFSREMKDKRRFSARSGEMFSFPIGYSPSFLPSHRRRAFEGIASFFPQREASPTPPSMTIPPFGSKKGAPS